MQWWPIVGLVAVGCGGDPAVVDAPIDAGPRCDPSAAFGPPEAIAELSTPLDDATPRLSTDELEIVFARKNTGNTFDLWTARRPSLDEPFGAPMLMTSVNSVNNEIWPTLSADGLVLMFDADRTTPGTYRVWSSTRSSPTGTFGPPTQRAELMPSESNPLLATDTALYFMTAARPGLGMRDIWRAEINASGVIGVPAALVGGVNTGAEEVTPAVTADERHIYFRRTTVMGSGMTMTSEDDVFVSSRSTPGDGWGPSAQVPSLSVAGVNETPGWVSADDCRLYLNATITGGLGINDLYVAKRAAPPE